MRTATVIWEARIRVESREGEIIEIERRLPPWGTGGEGVEGKELPSGSIVVVSRGNEKAGRRFIITKRMKRRR